MGGDRAPDMVLAGAALAHERQPYLRFLIFGDEARIKPLLKGSEAFCAACTIRHTDQAIASGMKPSMALRQGRQSSMRLALDAVAAGEAAGAVSAGNTGALMALAKFSLKTLPGIDRPAIATFLPTRQKGDVVILDLGANLVCGADNLVQFALMGAIFSRLVLGVEKPRIAVLNVGTEEMKGHEELRTAAADLRARASLPGEFVGFIEGDGIAVGDADVVVTDGFTGNVLLKAIEGTSKLYSEFLRQTFRSSLTAKLGYFLARRAFARLRARVDPRRYNGAMLLGLGGVCVKSHGGTDAFGFANAIGVAADLCEGGFNSLIAHEVDKHHNGQNVEANAAASVAANGDDTSDTLRANAS
ncbi:MAG: phosphate acyltransferase PlsX [Alphaproteobacteria bacterium]|nr:MAG: phosphate acyltransferase PlsX [Alphaproteobacteria bacterium]